MDIAAGVLEYQSVILPVIMSMKEGHLIVRERTPRVLDNRMLT
jgi:hypothetical protein